MSEQRIYRIRMHYQDKIIELYARHVGQAAIFGFVEIAGLSFGEEERLVVNPEAEALAREFEGVKRFFVPMHAILRIDEVERAGSARVLSGGSIKPATIVPFPTPQSRRD